MSASINLVGPKTTPGVPPIGTAAINTQVNTALNVLTAAVATETNRATAAEGVLTTATNTNATAISSETTARAAADTAEATARAAADSAEVTNRNAAIAVETSRATAAEGTLTTAVNTNANAISTETSRATAAEALLQTISGMASAVLGQVLTGLSTASSALVTASDSILAAIGKLQAQVSLKAPIDSPAFTTAVTTGTDTNGAPLTINGRAGQNRMIQIASASLQRWRIGANNTNESGSNTGSDFAIVPLDDSGATIGKALTVTRATGNLVALGGIDGTVIGAAVRAAGAFTSLLSGAGLFGAGTSPVIGARQTANGNDTLLFQRFTDTSPTGSLLRYVNAGNSANLVVIDIQGNELLAGSLTAAFVSLGTGGPTWTSGTGAPASTQPLGSMYSRTDGGVGTTLYVSRGAGTWNAVASV